MKNLVHVLVILFVMGLPDYGTAQQTQEELMKLKDVKLGAIDDHLAQISAIESELALIDAQISEVAGWRKGISGSFGFDFDRSRTWISNPNANSRSSALNLGLSGFMKYDQGKKFWYNQANVQKAWKNLDTDTEDDIDVGGLFANSTVDLVNLSSLAGYKLSDQLAVTALAELYSSLDRFTEQGAIDFGVGITWLPFSNLTVTVNPLNYHFLYTNNFGLESTGALGAKVKVDYNLKFKMFANNCTWQSSLFAFLPYNDAKMDIMNNPAVPNEVVFQSSLREYTWLNTLSLELWKGIGIGAGWGLRKSDFEALDAQAPKLQSFFNFGLSFTY